MNNVIIGRMWVNVSINECEWMNEWITSSKLKGERKECVRN